MRANFGVTGSVRDDQYEYEHGGDQSGDWIHTRKGDGVTHQERREHDPVKSKHLS